MAGNFEPRVLKTTDFSGTSGDGLINLAGFTGIDKPDGSIDLLVTNMRPGVDAENKIYLDQHVRGGNTTIEHFSMGAEKGELKHVRTYADKGIVTPNRVAIMDDGTFYITNDHGSYTMGWVSINSPCSCRAVD